MYSQEIAVFILAFKPWHFSQKLNFKKQAKPMFSVYFNVVLIYFCVKLFYLSFGELVLEIKQKFWDYLIMDIIDVFYNGMTQSNSFLI